MLTRIWMAPHAATRTQTTVGRPDPEISTVVVVAGLRAGREVKIGEKEGEDEVGFFPWGSWVRKSSALRNLQVQVGFFVETRLFGYKVEQCIADDFCCIARKLAVPGVVELFYSTNQCQISFTE